MITLPAKENRATTGKMKGRFPQEAMKTIMDGSMPVLSAELEERTSILDRRVPAPARSRRTSAVPVWVFSASCGGKTNTRDTIAAEAIT